MRTLILTYPPLGEAEAPMGGKFLQLSLEGRDYLLLAAGTEHRYHNQILAHFLEELGIAHRWEGPAKLVFEHPRLEVTGGGRFRLDLAQGSFLAWDDSSLYGRFDPGRLAAQLASAGPPWDGLALRVD
jgi:hypothetical protein